MDVLDELRAEGRKEGQAQMLLRQLAVRFGAVPAKVKARIRAADSPTLLCWSLRILTAPTLEAVLQGGTTAAAAKKPGASGAPPAPPKRRPTAQKRARAAR
jgi:hypothetical protein